MVMFSRSWRTALQAELFSSSSLVTDVSAADLPPTPEDGWHAGPTSSLPGLSTDFKKTKLRVKGLQEGFKQISIFHLHIAIFHHTEFPLISARSKIALVVTPESTFSQSVGSSSSFRSFELELGLRGIWDWYQSLLSSRASRISWASGWTRSAHVSHKGWTM